jgi:2-C-methyl-D-erythritol 4-phosphate cytidylyltransferase
LQTHPNTSTPRIHVLIPCGGTGSRAGGNSPKQYQALAGKALVWHTLMAFAPLLASGELISVTVVIAKDDTHFSNINIASINPHIYAIPVASITRALTVTNGLKHLLNSGDARSDDWVLVHDAARCLITTDAIRRLITACVQDEVGGLLAVPLADTMKTSTPSPSPRVSATVPREHKWLAQTPQMFRARTLYDALVAAVDAVTDEASAMEHAGMAALLVRGEASNIKVTYPEDFALAEAILKARTT